MSLFFIIGYTIKNSYKIQEQLLTDSLKNKAIAIFDLIVDMRHWNAQYDGVYVKSEKLEPNQYLNPNSIKSEKGETMVWVNPAFMTRQISDIASLRDGFKLKITSNKLINKNNAPDEDEKKILEILKSQEEPMTLGLVKVKSELSGKKWDKSSKNLTKYNLVKVEKIDDVVLMKLI